MKLNFAICSVLSLSSWWQQPLRKTYSLLCQNRSIVCDSFAYRKTKSCRKQCSLSAVADIGDLSAFVIEWQGTIGE